jgi:cytochrome c biogenesis factor
MISLSMAFADNSHTGLTKLWCLTNPTANSVLVITIASITVKKKHTLLTYTMFTGLASESSLLPLSNTFFAIHPPLLMAGVCICAVRLGRQQANLWSGLSVLGFAMALGGFWSTQELNWGG